MPVRKKLQTELRRKPPKVEPIIIPPQDVVVKNLPNTQDVVVKNIPEVQEVRVINQEKIELPEQRDSFSVDNFPEIQDVHVLNQPEINFPKRIKADVDFPRTQKVEVTNQKEVKFPSEIDIKEPKWFKKVTNFFEDLIDRISQNFFKVIPVDEDGKPIDFSKVGGGTQIIQGGGGGTNSYITNGDPLTEYKVSDTDDANDTKYYGFLKTDGGWYILREVTSTGAFRYSRGANGYPAAWTARASQTYDYLNVTF